MCCNNSQSVCNENNINSIYTSSLPHCSNINIDNYAR